MMAGEASTITDAQIDLLAAAAGLHRTLELFRDELHAAARQAAAERTALPQMLDPAQEPWPPMRVAR